METLNNKISRIKSSLELFENLWTQFKSNPTPGKRQSLMRSMQELNKNLLHQMHSLKSHISGSMYIITYREGDKTYKISFTNCSQQEALILTEAFSYSHKPQILEIQEIIASPEPIKL